MIHEKNTLSLYDKINVYVKVMEIVFRAFANLADGRFSESARKAIYQEWRVW
jgi:hypothetical protein